MAQVPQAVRRRPGVSASALYKYVHPEKMAVQAPSPREGWAELSSDPPDAWPFRRIKADSIALIVNERYEMITVDDQAGWHVPDFDLGVFRSVRTWIARGERFETSDVGNRVP